MSTSATTHAASPFSETAGDDESVYVHRSRRTAAELTRQLSVSPLMVVALTIAAGNLAIFVSLPWIQANYFGDTNPAIWLTIGLLVPALLICVSVYNVYWHKHERVSSHHEVLGPYVLREKLGAGGMGEVYLAEHQLMKRKCAVKFINPDQAYNRDMRNSFEREAKATAQLTHWNTVEVYDYGTSEDGRFYYVMEYLKGVNLWEYVNRYGPMPAGRVVYILKQLCDALYEADCAGLVHRDIKPSNVFLTERGRSCDVAKLLDFGLVQAVSSEPIRIRNVNRKLHGSPSFMCPEQAVGMTPDSRGDLYSLGAVAYFLLTGRPPFVDENPIMLIVAHATTAVPTFAEIGAKVPEDLANVILKCLHREPTARYASARKLRLALDACECSHAWSWQSAEDWWAEFNPGDETESEVLDPEPSQQATMAMDVAQHEVDFHEPTAVYTPVDEAVCS